ncbi:MAG: DoxX family protein [Xanthomonadales bacterium]|nr:DoxX family protein [Xanthomonadales bacterium]
MHAIQPLATLFGRLLLAYIFLLSGFGKISKFAGTAAYMASKGLPISEILLVATIIIEVGGGLMLVLGWKARWGALAIFLWMIPVTLIFHGYWAVEPEQVRTQMIQFNKNLAIMGGLLYVMVAGSGRYSLDKGA